MPSRPALTVWAEEVAAAYHALTEAGMEGYHAAQLIAHELGFRAEADQGTQAQHGPVSVYRLWAPPPPPPSAEEPGG